MSNREQWPSQSGEKPNEKKFRVCGGFPDSNATKKDQLMLELAVAYEIGHDHPYSGEFTEKQLDNFISSRIAETLPSEKEEIKKLLAEIKDEILTNHGYLATEKEIF